MDYFFTSSYVPSSSTSQDGSKDKKKNKKGATGGKKGASNGVKLSTDPQSVAARERRHRISDRFKILQSLVPGGSKMDTVSMLEGAINYVKFLQAQLVLHQTIMSLDDQDPSLNNNNNNNNCSSTLPADHGPFPPHQLSYLDTLNHSLPELKITSSLPLPEYSCFSGEDEATCTYGGFLKN